MADRKGFALAEALMGALSVATLVTMLVLLVFQSSIAVSGLSAARADRRFSALRADLERVTERQIRYYLERAEFAASPEELRFVETEGVSITFRTTASGWSAAAVHADLGDARGCVVYFGRAPSGRNPARPASPGEVACTE